MNDSGNVNVGDGGKLIGPAIVTNTGTVTTHYNYTRSEKEELDTFVRESVLSYERQLADLAHANAASTPYKFLLPFELGDKAIFFGRDRAIDALFKTLFNARLTVVHARSGAGKSSLIQAGLGPQLLNKGYLPIFARTYNNPVAAIIDEIANRGTPPRPHLLSTLQLRAFLSLVVSNMSRRFHELVIVLDQFEELFTQVSLQERADHFTELASCIEDDGLPARFVLAVRGDFFSDLAQLQKRLPHIFYNSFYLEQMGTQEIQAAITGPVQKVDPGVTYEQALLEELTTELAKSEMDLPTLQIVCTRLYKMAKDKLASCITRDLYQAAGGMQGISEGYLDQELNNFSPVERPTAWQILVQLVDTRGQRRILTRAEISRPTGVDEELLQSLLARLVNARLVRREAGERYDMAQDHLAAAIRERLGPQRLAIKQVRELLKREIDSWHADRSLIPRERLEIIYQQRRLLSTFDDDTIICLLQSAMRADFEVDDWRELANPAIVVRLVADLQDGNPNVRQQTIKVLGYLRLPDTLLIEVLAKLSSLLQQSNDWETKLETALALRRLGADGIDRLLNLLDTRTDRLTSRAVMEAFRRHPDPSAVAKLTHLLDLETDDEQIILLAQTLVAHNENKAIPQLVRVLLRLQGWQYSQVRKKLVQIIKMLQDNARTEEEKHLRELILVYQGNIAKLEKQIAAFSEQEARVELINNLDYNRGQLRQHRDQLDQILGHRRALEEPVMQFRLVSVLGLEETREIVDGLTLPRILNTLLGILANQANNDLWLDCATMLCGFYEQAENVRKPLDRWRQRQRLLEYERAKADTRVSLVVVEKPSIGMG